MKYGQWSAMAAKKNNARSNPAACRTCGAKCCKYFALEIDPPEDYETVQDIRWYLAHRRVSVYVYRKRWYLDVENRCRHLTRDLRCRIYAHRPKICRDYPVEGCEHTGGHFSHPLWFRSLESFDRWWEAEKRKRRAAKRRKRGSRVQGRRSKVKDRKRP